jgi:uncharacterized membrane protein
VGVVRSLIGECLVLFDEDEEMYQMARITYIRRVTRIIYIFTRFAPINCPLPDTFAGDIIAFNIVVKHESSRARSPPLSLSLSRYAMMFSSFWERAALLLLWLLLLLLLLLLLFRMFWTNIRASELPKRKSLMAHS